MSQNIWGFPSNQSTTFAEALGYKSYVAYITQTGVNPPVYTVLENTLGVDLTWTYDGPGFYHASNQIFLNQTGKVVAFCTLNNSNSFVIQAGLNTGQQLEIVVYDETWNNVDIQGNAVVEFRLYP